MEGLSIAAVLPSKNQGLLFYLVENYDRIELLLSIHSQNKNYQFLISWGEAKNLVLFLAS